MTIRGETLHLPHTFITKLSHSNKNHRTETDGEFYNLSLYCL